MGRFVLVLVLASGVTLVAQQAATPTEKPLTFEVASVKPRSPNDTSVLRFPTFEPGGRFVMVNAPLTALLPQLYPATRIEGRPSWLGTDGFDISAKAAGEPSRDQMLEMLRSLLRDRFKFAAHNEMREDDTFTLVRVDPQRLGSGLRPIDLDCVARAAAAKAGEPVPPLPDAPNGMPVCRTRSVSGSLTSGGMTATTLANALRDGAGRPVFDQTGLTGHYEVTLKYFDGPPENRGLSDQVDFFTAVREQLGLRLEAKRRPVQVIVIDRIERPTPD